jgi:two-component system response regulator RpfG
MTVLSILFSIIILIFLLTDRKLFNRFIEGISSSLKYVENILIHCPQDDNSISKTDILEVNEMNRLIQKISDEINFNNQFMEYSTYGDLDLILDNIQALLKSRMSCDRIALAFIDESGNLTAENALVQYNQTFLNPGYIEPIENTSLPDLLKTGQPRIINDLVKYSEENKISKSTKLILKEGINSSITIPMMSDKRCLGFFFVSSCDRNSYDSEMANFVLRIINLSKKKLYIEYLFQKIISETSNSFVNLMEEKDNETSAHIVRMSQYSYITSRAYHENITPLTPRFMREILWYSPLHDIGKVGIPDSILLKEGPLDNSEMEIMKGHVNSGKRVMENMNIKLDRIVEFPIMKTAVDIVAGHHEKFNGNGYPLGLSGEDIPLAGRIVAIADVFDALTSKRTYKEAYSIEKALDIMETSMSGSFDPQVMSSFIIALPQIETVYERFKEV